MSKIFDPATTFNFTPASYVPFKDRELCEKLRKISGKDLEKHTRADQHPDFDIHVMMNPHPVLIATLFSRIKEASEKGKKIKVNYAEELYDERRWFGIKLEEGANEISISFNGNEKAAEITVNGTTKPLGYIGNDVYISYITIFTGLNAQIALDKFIAIREA